MSPSNAQAPQVEAPFIDLVLECDQESTGNDSFSTLGLHSIFSEDDLRHAASRLRGEEDESKQHNRKPSGAPLEKFLDEVESSSAACPNDEMDLRNLLRKGSRLAESVDKIRCWHESFRGGDISGEKHPRFQGNRWLESSGKSVSCRNLSYDASESLSTCRRSKACRDIVTKAIEMAAARPSSPPPPLMDVSGQSLMDVSGQSELSEADDIDQSIPNRSTGRSIGRRGKWMSQSCRNFSDKERENARSATPLSALNMRNSVTIMPGTPNSRKTMLSMGKSLSSRNLSEDSAPSTPKRTPKRLMKSKSHRHFRAQDCPISPPPLTPNGKRSSNPRRLTVKSKSARHFSARDREEQDLQPPPSPMKRSNKKRESFQKQASFNGRKFLSYNRSLSCIDIDAEERSACSRWTTSADEKSDEEGPMLPKREVTGHCRTISTAPPKPSMPLETPKATEQAPPRRDSFSQSLSSFLAKRVESEKIAVAVEAIPTSRRSLLARKGRSKSARNLSDGRKSKLSVGRSLSARNLMDVEDKEVPELSPIPASPVQSVNLSVCQEVSSREEMDLSALDISGHGMDESSPDSLPGLSPMTPLKSPCYIPARSSSSSLPVVGEEIVTQAISSPPLTSPERGAGASVPSAGTEETAEETDSADSPEAKDKSDKPVFSTEAIRKELGSLRDSRMSNDDALSPIKEKGAKSPMASSKVRSGRRLSDTKETVSKPVIAASNQSSLKAALQKSVRGASLDSKTQPKGKRSSYRESSRDSKSSRAKDGRKKSSLRNSLDAKPRKSSQEGKPPSTRRTSLDCKQSTVSARLCAKESKPSSLKAALDKSSQGKPASGRRMSSSSSRQQSSRHGMKKDDRQRSSRNLGKKDSQRNLTKKESQRNMTRKESQRNLAKRESQRNLTKKESQRNLAKKDSQRHLSRKESQRNMTKRDSQRNLSTSIQGSARHRITKEKRLAHQSSHSAPDGHSPAAPREKRLSQSAHSNSGRRKLRSGCDENETTISVSIHLEQDAEPETSPELHNSTSTNGSNSRNHKKQQRQRSSRKLSTEEPLEGSLRNSTSTRGSGKKDGSKRGVRKRRSSSSRAESPNCVANYSVADKENKENKRGNEFSRKKRPSVRSLASKLDPADATGSGRRSRQLHSSMRDLYSARRLSGDSHRTPPCDKSHSSWSTADFSSVVW